MRLKIAENDVLKDHVREVDKQCDTLKEEKRNVTNTLEQLTASLGAEKAKLEFCQQEKSALQVSVLFFDIFFETWLFGLHSTPLNRKVKRISTVRFNSSIIAK